MDTHGQQNNWYIADYLLRCKYHLHKVTGLPFQDLDNKNQVDTLNKKLILQVHKSQKNMDCILLKLKDNHFLLDKAYKLIILVNQRRYHPHKDCTKLHQRYYNIPLNILKVTLKDFRKNSQQYMDYTAKHLLEYYSTPEDM